MFKYPVIIIKIAGMICFLALTLGCGDKAEPPQATKVATKKIVVKKPISKPIPSKPASKAITPAQKPKPVPEKKSDSAKKIQPPVSAAKQPAKKPIPATAKKSEPTQKATPAALVTTKKTAKPEPVVAKQMAEKVKPKKPPAQSAQKAQVKLPPSKKGTYSPGGKTDPFVPLYKETPVTVAAKKKKKRRMPLTPLERVDLSQLKLVGIIRSPRGNKALVQEASGKGYIIKQGTFIGIHAGRVLQILKDRIVVEEEVESALGRYTLEKRELKLQKPPGEF